MRTIMFIVQYNDPDRAAEGQVKTRHFPSLKKAEEFADRLKPPVFDVKIIRQESTIIRERVQ